MLPPANSAAAAANETAILSPRVAYDRIAGAFDDWRWSRFWREYEAPLVLAWIEAQRAGVACDVGCGTGHYLAALARRVPTVIGVDVSDAMLRAARRAAPHAHLVQASVEQLPLARGRVNALLCTRTLSHVADLERALREIARVCAPGAALLLTDVHPDHPYTHTRVPVAGATVRIETHQHPLARLESALGRVGFSVQDLRQYSRSHLRPAPDPLRFPKLYRGDVPVFYLLAARRDRPRLNSGGRRVHAALPSVSASATGPALR